MNFPGKGVLKISFRVVRLALCRQGIHQARYVNHRVRDRVALVICGKTTNHILAG